MLHSLTNAYHDHPTMLEDDHAHYSSGVQSPSTTGLIPHKDSELPIPVESEEDPSTTPDQPESHFLIYVRIESSH